MRETPSLTLQSLADELRVRLRALPAAARRGPVSAAVSGGADSVALLHALALLRAERELDGLSVAHVDHGLRAGSAGDAEFVRELASSLGVPFLQRRLAMGAPAPGRSAETKARELRLAALAEMAAEAGAVVLATAHHRDDQIETVLFRILRGTGVAGLRGIPRVRRFAPGAPLLLWRPLLAVTRADLRGVLSGAGVAWREDPTNASGDATRNRIRLELRPFLERCFGPAIDAALLALIASADEVTAMVEAEAEALARHCLEVPFAGRALLGLEAASAPGPVRQALVREALRRLDPLRFIGPPPLLLEEAAALLDAAVPRGARRGGRSGVLVERAGRGVIFQRLPLPGAARSVLIEGLPAVVAWPFPPQDLMVSRGAPDTGLALGRGGRVATVAAGAAPLPLEVSVPRSGDRFHPLGGVPQRLASFLAARGVPRLDRGYWPLVREASGEIVWVVGVEISHRVRIVDATADVLRMECRAREG